MPIISDSKTLKKRIEALKKEPFVAIDTEFMRERTYFPILCLVQIAGENDAFAIDTLAKDMDLSPFFALLKNKKITKVFHAADQDLEIIHGLINGMPTPVFDSQIAAQVLGYGEAVGYGNLVKAITGANIDKSSRFTDWSMRPLSDAQIEYALADVTHHRDVYAVLAKELKDKKRESWFKEEMADLTDLSHYEFHPENAWKRFRVRHASPVFLGVLRTVAEWRECQAQERNVPRGRILRDEAVLEIAAAKPKRGDELARLRHIHPNLLKDQKLVQGLCEAVEEGAEKPVHREKQASDYDRDSALLELLRVLLKAECEAQNVARVVVANDDDLKIIAHQSEAELKKSDVRAMHGWRYEVFGKVALALKRGELALSADNRQVKILTLPHAKKSKAKK